MFSTAAIHVINEKKKGKGGCPAHWPSSMVPESVDRLQKEREDGEYGPKRYTGLPCRIEDVPEVNVVAISHNQYDQYAVTSLVVAHDGLFGLSRVTDSMRIFKDVRARKAAAMHWE
ncbi:hypothetical protein EDD85DRAFT_794156 [Armillaria nabsnona]|nr:hypothetical protein EDD85DRAFT_794156 [Armillaria nabsnona]